MPRIDAAGFAASRPTHALLDVRDSAAFALGHLAGSGHIPFAELRERRAELPPRGRALLVVADHGDAAGAAAEAIAALGYARVTWLDAPLVTVPDAALIAGEPERLWQPAPFLEEVLGLLPRGRSLDLAAGAGREAVFLALHGFTVEAWDHDADVLVRAERLADRHGVAILTNVVDLEAEGLALPAARFQLVTVFRFLQRRIFPQIEQALAPGGHLVYETFRRGQERFGRPKQARYLLADGELARAFPSLEVLRYDELDGPAGPVLARLHARRPA